jgi:hypothetical protein
MLLGSTQTKFAGRKLLPLCLRVPMRLLYVSISAELRILMVLRGRGLCVMQLRAYCCYLSATDGDAAAAAAEANGILEV